MKIKKNKIASSYLITLNSFEDERGSFTRLFDKKVFRELKVSNQVVQTNFSVSKKKGTIRGFHFQKKPFEEMKSVTCIKGEIFDVIIDLRKKSKTYMKWEGFRLNENRRHILIVPAGCAHAFQTLTNNAEVLYFCSQFYNPKKESGIRWNDKKFKVKWPIKPSNISQKDKNWDDYI